MYFAQFRPYDIANGRGVRCSLFVSGCTHNCPGCFNQDYQNFTYGEVWNQKIEEQLKAQMLLPQIDGLTLLGGEPMQNCEGLIPIIKRLRDFLKENHLEKSIWLYSGYTYEQILADTKRLQLLQLVDVLVDGLFIEELKDPSLAFRGSKNQRIIDVPNSLKQNIVLELSY